MMFARWTATVLTLRSSFAAIVAVRQAVADELEHLQLARREPVALALARRRIATTRRVEHRLAGRHALDRGGEIEIERVLEHVAARAGVHRLAHERLLRVHAEHQDRRVGEPREDARASPPARWSPASRIHDDDVRLELAASAIASSPSAGLADDDDRRDRLRAAGGSRGGPGCDRRRAGR